MGNATIIQLVGKCIQCGKKFTLTSEQIIEAKVAGVLISNCCFFPATLESASIKSQKKSKRKINKK